MEYPLLNVLVTMLWFFLWVLWFMLLFRVFADIFRDDSLNGWAKAGWSIVVILLPLLGVFIYLIARGRGMGQREVSWARGYEARYYGPAAAERMRVASQADELARLADLKEHGHLTDQEYEQAKARVLSG
ncbi:SHOCT domain-containing protein [Nonomuraea lactucae]|uniref:SHOCT domain-containing protein n=1 Tax=Nonomuraea lactucae TaxID=2249762 RepID=UPI000DE2FF64|nr:SHOCT domain-containing protein [Nonomuraea lactucae]